MLHVAKINLKNPRLNFFKRCVLPGDLVTCTEDQEIQPLSGSVGIDAFQFLNLFWPWFVIFLYNPCMVSVDFVLLISFLRVSAYGLIIRNNCYGRAG